MEGVGVYWRIVLKPALKKWAGREWTGFIWLRIETSGRLL
jgi:hypothetical protein